MFICEKRPFSRKSGQMLDLFSSRNTTRTIPFLRPDHPAHVLEISRFRLGGFEPLRTQTNDFEIVTCSFPARHLVLLG